MGLFSELTRVQHERARIEEPGLPELPGETFLVMTGGLEELLREHMRTKGADTLTELVEPAFAVTLAVFGADATGRGIAR